MFEGLENPSFLLRGKANARILDLKTHQEIIAIGVQQDGAQGNGALLGEFDGVAGVIKQGLAQPGRVATEPEWNSVAVGLNRQPFCFRRIGDQGTDVIEDGGKVEIGVLQLQFSGFDLGQIQHVIKNRKEVPGGGSNLVQSPGLLGGRSGPLQQVGQPQDRVHRGANLVAHVGQKGALGPVGGFGSLPRLS